MTAFLGVYKGKGPVGETDPLEKVFLLWGVAKTIMYWGYFIYTIFCRESVNKIIKNQVKLLCKFSNGAKTLYKKSKSKPQKIPAAKINATE